MLHVSTEVAFLGGSSAYMEVASALISLGPAD